MVKVDAVQLLVVVVGQRHVPRWSQGDAGLLPQLRAEALIELALRVRWVAPVANHGLRDLEPVMGCLLVAVF